MAYDQWGRWMPDYQPQNPMDYREELRKQREAIDYRLSEFDKRYQTQTPSVSEPPHGGVAYSASQPPTSETIDQPYIVVANEEEAREYPIVKTLDDKIGRVHIFVTSDERTMIAKRINPGTFSPEVEIYDKRTKSTAEETSSEGGENLLVSIDSRLKKIEEIVDTAVLMFMNQETKKQDMNKGLPALAEVEDD